MTGGYHSSRQRDRDRSLADRVDPAARTQPARLDPTAADPKPCWLSPAEQPVPAHVLGWVPTPDGQWRALVLLEVAATEVHPRPPT